ncbi:MAG: phosphatidylglycerophosphatase A family protein [Gammaproteobacteria bacterium]
MRDYTVPPIPDSIWQKPSHFIAFGFGSGAIPIAPGTFGTLLAIPFYLALRNLPNGIYLAVVILIMLGSMWLCSKVSRELDVHDHQGMNIDEFVGYLVTMYAAPHGIKWIFIGFILFRLFDILKPQPIRYIDAKFTGGIGVVLDDVVAGIFSFLVIRVLHWMI